MRISNGTLYSSAVSGEWIEQLHLRLNICISCLGKNPSVKSLIVQDQVLNICCLKGLRWYINIILILSHAMHLFALHKANTVLGSSVIQARLCLTYVRNLSGSVTQATETAFSSEWCRTLHQGLFRKGDLSATVRAGQITDFPEGYPTAKER